MGRKKKEIIAEKTENLDEVIPTQKELEEKAYKSALEKCFSTKEPNYPKYEGDVKFRYKDIYTGTEMIGSGKIIKVCAWHEDWCYTIKADEETIANSPYNFRVFSGRKSMADPNQGSWEDIHIMHPMIVKQ